MCIVGAVGQTYQLTCPQCGYWLVEWTPAPGGSVRARCDHKNCKHHVKFSFDGDCLQARILPRDLYSRLRELFVWLPLPISLPEEQTITHEGRRYRLTIAPLD